MTRKLMFIFIISCLIFPVLQKDLIAEDDYETWKKKQQEAFENYRTEQDEAFASYLEEQWTAFDAFKELSPDSTPKPKEIPVSKTKPKQLPTLKEIKLIPLPPKPKEDVKPIPESDIKTEVKKEIKPSPQKEKTLKTARTLETAEIAETQTEKNQMIELPKHNLDNKLQKNKDLINQKIEAHNELRITFWGMPLDFPKTDPLKLSSPINEKAIARFWYDTSGMDYPTYISRLNTYRNQMNLNDWAYCQLLKELGDQMGNSNRESILFVWFMLNKTGFSSRVGYRDNQIYLLLPSENTIFGVSYLQINGRKYHIFAFDGKQDSNVALYTYKKDFPEADNLIDLSFKTPPKVKQLLVKKDYQFKYGIKDYIIPVVYDVNLVKFYESYPRTDLNVYFNAMSSENVLYSLAKGLQPILEGRSQADAVNVILRFVQTAFKYKTDQDQFGHEKAFFAEEIVYYPFSDCEDRSILFTFLVSNLLELPVIALDYPGHISAAVKLDVEVKGDKIMYNNKYYTICDPTYINADIGMAMPKFKKVKPEIIALANL